MTKAWLGSSVHVASPTKVDFDWAAGGSNSNPTLLSVRSRKVHGAAGTFDLNVDHTQPIGGELTVEPRSIGLGHSLAFQFSEPVTSVGAVTVMPLGTASATFAGSEIVVALTNVADNQRVTITVTGVNGSQTTYQASIGFLVGDANNSRTVSAQDVNAIRLRSGQAATALNFNFDLNASGLISASDVSAAKARSGRTLQ